MRIKKVRIRNFRSIIDTGEISLDDKITVLLGKNEQGKTNFLKALESFGKGYEYDVDDLSYLVIHEKELQQIPVITIWFELDEDEKRILSSINEEFEKQTKLVITKYADGHYEIEQPDLRKIPSKINEIKQSILKILKENKNKINESFDLLNQIDKNKHINWLKSLQNADGGFGHIPGQTSNITHTYFAVKALMELGALNQIDKNKLLQFILSCQNPNGGFGHLPNQPPQTQFTYHAIMLLKELDALSQIDNNKHINWLKSLQRPDGGFSHQPGQASHITNTYFAIKALAELGALNQIDKKKVVEFLVSCQNPNGGFGHLPNQPPQTQFTYHAIFLLKELRKYFTEDYNINIRRIEKAHEPEEIEKSANNIIGNKILDEKLINIIKKEVVNLKNFKENNIRMKILEMIPKFVYFDSVDIIEDSIPLNEYLENREKYKTFTNLFRLAGLDVEKIKDTKNPHTISRFFKKATTRITGMINEFWEQEEVTVNLEMIGDKILISIDDNLGAKADPPSRRSDGFRWFLSFYINFMAGTKGELRNAILLLDNPGWVLHPSGQKDLLKALEEIAKTNQIVLATHSPFLIDKNKLERIRIIERKEGDGTKVYEKFWDSPYDSLQVVRSSIGADISDSLFGHKNNIVMEGFSDKIYLETMNNYLKREDKNTIDFNKVVIIGVGGADKIPYILAWLKAERYNSLAILDADNEGRKVNQEIENRNIEVDRDSDILMLNEISEEFRGKDIEMEDLFDEEFYNMAVNKAYRDIFESKLGKSEIRLDEIPTNGLRTKRYSKFFKDNNLGGFDKVKVALEIKKILSRRMSKDTENMLEETINNFEKLFYKIKEKFKRKGIDL